MSSDLYAPGGGGPPSDPYFTSATFYLEDDAGNPLDFSLLDGTRTVWVTRWLLQKDENGEAVFTLRIELHEPE